MSEHMDTIERYMEEMQKNPEKFWAFLQNKLI